PAAAHRSQPGTRCTARRCHAQSSDVRRRPTWPAYIDRFVSGGQPMIQFWVAVLAISTLHYALLDGFTLGIGILFGAKRDEVEREAMMNAVAPIWDGNQTWLVVTGVVLWGAFPAVYAILLSAFYLPLLFMLAGWILRGVAFKFRHNTTRMRWIWNASFAGGSLIAAFMQGLTVGALVEG